MTDRTLVPIVVFWAILTIITPTLVFLSENSKADFDLDGNTTKGMKIRRFRRKVGYIENHVIRIPPVMKMVAAEELVPAPAPARAPASLGTRRATLMGSYNLTLRRNSSDYGEKHFKQAKI